MSRLLSHLTIVIGLLVHSIVYVCVLFCGYIVQGYFYDVEELDRLVAEKNKETGWELGIHVDAASGGFTAPFTFPDLKW